MGKKSAGTQTVTQQTQPWAPSQPYINQLLGQAGALTQNTMYTPVSQGVAQITPNQQQALSGIAARAREGSPLLQQAQGSVGDILNKNAGRIDAGRLVDLYNREYDSTPLAQQYLGNMASGSMIGNNPYINQMLAGISSDVNKQVGGQFGSSGMFGSTNYAEALGRGLGRAQTDFLGNQYNQDVANQLAAAGQVQSAYDTLQNRLAGLASAETGIQGQNIANQLQQRQQALQAAAMAPSLAAADYADLGQLLNVGNIQQQQQQANLDFQNQNPWNVLSQFGNIALGAGGMGGTSTQSQPLTRNVGAGLLGGAATGAALGSIIPGIGTGLGAVGGGLLGLFG